jgi:SAM-dependent methyltransferase
MKKNDPEFTKHLDLGCGLLPRNPYNAPSCYGIDIREIDDNLTQLNFQYVKANLITEKIPYSDNFFDSVSAFDFLEHVPRQLILANGELSNPFIELMNEIYRVLKPNGKFLALTPVYPHPSAFVDPTHVNFITTKTHEYFTGINPSGAMYGFNGNFECLQAKLETPKNIYRANDFLMRKILRKISRVLFNGGISHILWEFCANKPVIK